MSQEKSEKEFPMKKILLIALVLAVGTILAIGGVMVTDTSEDSNSSERGKWLFAMDTAGVSSLYGIRGVPTLVIVDPNGYLAYYRSGTHGANTLLRIIENVSSGADPIFRLKMNEIESELNQGEVPEELENEFESGGGSIPENTPVKKSGDKWKIHLSNLVYVIREKDGKANVYLKAPDFTVTTFDNRTFTLSEQKGEVVLIDIMGVGCPPCKQQMPELRKVKLEKGENITILSVDIYYSGETKKEVRDVFGEYILE